MKVLTQTLMIAAILVLSVAGVGYGQTSPCDPSAPARSLQLSSEALLVAFVSVQHTSASLVAYRGEIVTERDVDSNSASPRATPLPTQLSPVTSWAIPKDRVTLAPGVPESCYVAAVPRLSGVEPGAWHRIRIVAVGLTGSSVSDPSIDRVAWQVGLFARLFGRGDGETGSRRPDPLDLFRPTRDELPTVGRPRLAGLE